MRITPATELKSRIEKLQQQLLANQLDAALFLQNADLFYLTGSVQQGVLFVPAEGEPVYLVRKDLQRSRMECGLRDIVPFKSPKDIPGILSDFNLKMPKTLGMELDVLPVLTYNRFMKIFTDCVVSDVSPLIRTVRAVKSDYEINIMKDAALMMDKVYRHAQTIIRPGLRDLDLSAELEFVARKEGHQGITRLRGFNSELFFGHVFSGTDSAAPAFVDAPLGGLGVNPSIGQGASYKPIRENEPICIDMISAFDGYMVDQTRILCIGGMDEKLVQAYADMRKIQDRLKAIARPGVAWGEIYDQCYNLACELGYKDHFMGNAGAQVSFIGHGIGVEVDEFPFIARGFNEQVLEKKMTFAFEPKAVFAGLGAVGIENTFWVEDDGLKHLTYSDEELKIL